MRIRIITVIVLSLALAVCKSDKPCDQESGLSLMQQGDWAAAFSHLEQCQSASDTSPETLVALALIYSSLDTLEGYEGTDPVSNAKRAYDLFVEASMLGDQGAIDVLIGFHRDGLENPRIEPNKAIASCLSSIAGLTLDDEPRLAERVSTCLAIQQ